MRRESVITAWGKATRSEVYDHYHGRGSWDRLVRGWLLVGSASALALPVLLPLGLVHVVAGYDAWSQGGALLAVVLALLSFGTARLSSR